MNRQVVGALFCVVAAVLYAARHLGAAMIVSTRTGNLAEEQQFALQVGGAEWLGLAVVALLVGLAYLVWAEYERRAGRT